jgi:hypothetical protein
MTCQRQSIEQGGNNPTWLRLDRRTRKRFWLRFKVTARLLDDGLWPKDHDIIELGQTHIRMCHKLLNHCGRNLD